MLTLCAAATAAAQQRPASQYLIFGGRTFNNDILMSTDLAQLSQTHNFGTARVMGLGGAFASLGADLSSMSINPAGMGMYRRNEISFTPFVSVGHAETEGTAPWINNNKTRFAFSNIGVALNVYESASSPLTSLTLGVGMNRIADFNTRYSFSYGEKWDPSNPNVYVPTIAECYGQQLGQAGIFPDGQGHIYYDYRGDGPNTPEYWPAILGYDGYMLDVGTGSDGRYWYPGRIGQNASILRSMDVITSGSVNEFALSLGGNINNVFYFGATLGLQSVYRKVCTTYQEEYDYFDSNGYAISNSQELPEQLDYARSYQESAASGSGVNFKLGFIVRPVGGLRIGAAFHTPTYYSLDYAYRAAIITRRHDNPANPDDTQFVNYAYGTPITQRDNRNISWDFVSPSRLMVGLSYTFGQAAIISVDYQRDWYNGIRMKNSPYYNMADDLKYEYKTYYQPTNTVRAGIELKPARFLALRAGGGYTDSMFRDRSRYYDMPSVYETYYFSGGLGFTLSRSCTLDFAYQYVSQKQTPYELFISEWRDGNDPGYAEINTNSGLYDTSQTRHYISMTLGFRF